MGEEVMFWIIALLVLWTKVSFIRVFMLLGRKNHKDTLADKVMLAPALAIAYTYSLFRKD